LAEEGADRAAQVREALNRLEASGVLSDTEVAEAEAAARLRRGEAPGRVTQVLRRKGVAGSVVQAAVQEAMAEDDFDERAACRLVAEKRARALRALPPDVATRRLLGFLQRRGYGGGVARDVTREVLSARGESGAEWEDEDETRLADETVD
jgi:regulatory protein